MGDAYIVQGVGESTGCRQLTKVLIKCGIYGSAEHTQEFQHVMYNDDGFAKWVKSKNLRNLVVRQSFPHGSNLPSLYNWYYRLKKSGFNKVYTIISTRSQPAQIISTGANDHLTNNPVNEFMVNPINRIKSAYLKIFGDLSKIENGNYLDFVVVNIGDISSYSYVNLRFLLESINIVAPKNFDFDMSKKDIDKNRIIEYGNLYYNKY